MKLTGDLEKKVNAAADPAEAKRLIEQAGMLLTDDELNQVAGGSLSGSCPKGGTHEYTDDPSVYEKFNVTYVPGAKKLCKKCGALQFGILRDLI